MKIVGIYKITSPSGRVYIGQSWDMKKRWYNYRGNVANKQHHLHASFRKYGARNHEYKVVHELPSDTSQEVMDSYEQLYMDLYRGCGMKLMNLKEGGSKGKHTEESLKRMSIALTGVPRKRDPNKKINRAPQSEITKMKISEANLGYKHTDAAKAKMKEARKHQIWQPCTEEAKRKISAKNKGRKLSQEHIDRVREVNIGNKNAEGHRHSPETKEKMRNAKLGRKVDPATTAKRIAAYKITCEKRRVAC